MCVECTRDLISAFDGINAEEYTALEVIQGSGQVTSLTQTSRELQPLASFLMERLQCPAGARICVRLVQLSLLSAPPRKSRPRCLWTPVRW